jgi:hypothetical protein
MKHELQEPVELFVRDEQTRRFMFNARALQVLGIDPKWMLERGHPVNDSETFQRDQAMPVSSWRA